MRDDLLDTLTKMYQEWCRLKGYKLPTAPIEQMIDDATGSEKARMLEFLDWLKSEVIPRMPAI